MLKIIGKTVLISLLLNAVTTLSVFARDTQVKTTIEISSSANPSVYGQWVTFTATVRANNNVERVPAGKMTFKQGNIVLASETLDKSGRATFRTSRLKATGLSFYSISAVYAGNDNFRTSSSSVLKQKIIPVTLTVTAKNQLRTCGAANPPLTASYSGFVNGETLGTGNVTGSPRLSTRATTNSAVGSYPIIITTGTLTSVNYHFVFVNGTLTVTPPTTPPNNPVQSVSMAQLQLQVDQSVKISLVGPPNQTFVIEASTDMIHWTAISTNTADANGSFTLVDPEAKNYPCRFYRSVINQ